MNDAIVKLKEQIDANEQPLFFLCSGYAGHENTMNALIEMGYASKRYITNREGDVEDIIWYYKGPNPIQVKLVHSDKKWIVNPNDEI